MLFLKSPPELILASTSAYRRQLLERLALPFSCQAPGVDETALAGEKPLNLVTRLARAKAQAVAARFPNAFVIGSDQIAILAQGPHDRVLGKPGSVENCVEQLLACSGQVVSFVTAVRLVRHQDGQDFEFLDTTRVKFRTLDRETIDRYVLKERPLDCAGGFKSEALGIALCEEIDSQDPSALIGLPLIRLCALLRQVGFQLP